MSVAASATPAMALARHERWLVARFAEEHDVLSWAVVGGGRRRAFAVAWHEVGNDELRPPVEPAKLLEQRLGDAGLVGAVGLMTSRRLDAYVEETSDWAGASARCVATVGLGNALRAGDPPGVTGRIGTVNLLCRVSVPLTEGGLLEMSSIAVEARTLAIIESGVSSMRSGARATGTGTDCVVVAAPSAGGERAAFAGKHTVVGHLVGASVYRAVIAGAAAWQKERRERSRPCT